MKQYHEYEAEAAKMLDFVKQDPAPQKVATYWSYTGGVATQHPDIASAKRASKLTETVYTATAEYVEYWEKAKQVSAIAHLEWYKDLREECGYLNVKQFNAAYSKVYDLAHSSGYDAITDKFDELVEFYITMKNLAE